MTFPKYKNKHLEEALVNPGQIVKILKSKIKFPSRCIIFYDRKLFNYVKRKYKPKKIKELSKVHTDFYLYKNIGLIRIRGIGCPMAAVVLEEFIERGGKTFLNIGTAGGLQYEGIFLCTKALRDEGTSYHYLPHGDYTFPDEELTKKFSKVLEKNKLKYSEGVTWTIDAPYRETKREIAHYKKKGVSTVEMEASALFAVAKLKKVKIASAFVVSDVLGDKWEVNFDKFEVKNGLRRLFDSAVECLGK